MEGAGTSFTTMFKLLYSIETAQVPQAKKGEHGPFSRCDSCE